MKINIYFFFFFYQTLILIKTSLVQIYTKWGKELDPNKILPEYPRPQFVRDSYLNLNGLWNFSTSTKPTFPKTFTSKILVPFLIESPLSKIGKHYKTGTYFFYNKICDFSKLKNGKIILHFGAVDQICELFIDGKKVGEHHGGYSSFSFDISEYITDIKNVRIDLRVVDFFDKDGEAYGKQKEVRGGIWYVQTSGVWKTIWVESVPNTYIKDVKINVDYDKCFVAFTPEILGATNQSGSVEITDMHYKNIAKGLLFKDKSTIVKMPFHFKSWSPEEPYLYNIKYTLNKDKVSSYFGMRKFSISKDKNNIKRLFLNNKPYFHNGLLDQGYWSDGIYTPPSDDAIIYDIKTMKDLGFNTLRKHIKIEPMRWYYYCDIFGMLVWQDAVSGGKQPYKLEAVVDPIKLGRISHFPDDTYSLFGRDKEIYRKTYYRELSEMIEELYNVVSISTWVPFNEGWGQFDANKVVTFIRKKDTSRHIDQASGWQDQGGGDFKSYHVYGEKIKIGTPVDERVVVLSEFGGYSLGVKGHIGSDSIYGARMFYHWKEMNSELERLYEDELIPAIRKGVSAAIYTQVSDVEDEVSGLFTYDREVLKVDGQMMRRVNRKIKY